MLSAYLLALFAVKGVFIPVVALGLVGITAFYSRPIAKRYVIVVGGLIAWGAASAYWSLDADHTLLTAFKLLMLTTLGTLAIRNIAAEEKPIEAGIVLGASLAALALLVLSLPVDSIQEKVLSMRKGISSFNNGANFLSVMIWPAIFVAWRQYGAVVAACILVIGVAALYLSDSDAATFSMAIAGLGFLGTRILPRSLIKVIAVLLGLTSLASPLIVKNYLNPEVAFTKFKPLFNQTSHQHRIYILDQYTKRSFEQPVLGHGLGASKVFHKDRDFSEDQELWRILTTLSTNTKDVNIAGNSLHAHNMSIQVWFELGAVGATLLALLLTMLMWDISNLQSMRQRQLGVILMGTTLAIAHTSHSSVQTWWLASIMLAVFGFFTFKHIDDTKNT
ncbi:MAG: O-antigen ligase family protein [Alphaproteobacteria bacterium]